MHGHLQQNEFKKNELRHLWKHALPPSIASAARDLAKMPSRRSRPAQPGIASTKMPSKRSRPAQPSTASITDVVADTAAKKKKTGTADKVVADTAAPLQKKKKIALANLPEQARMWNAFQQADRVRSLLVGSDCSGWCSEIQAAEGVWSLGPMRHLFASDNAARCRKLIEHCFQPMHVFKNICDRPIPEVALDIYVAGWP